MTFDDEVLALHLRANTARFMRRYRVRLARPEVIRLVTWREGDDTYIQVPR